MLAVITGGSGSGKSEYAENLILKLAEKEHLPRFYIATMFPFDEESHRRIARHRAMRSQKQFQTIERYVNIGALELPGNSVALLECMSNLTANELYQEQGAGEETKKAVLEGVKSLYEACAHLVIVTNEIGSDGIAYDAETIRYQQYLAAINKELAKEADLVIEVVCGIPIPLKMPFQEEVQKGMGGQL